MQTILELLQTYQAYVADSNYWHDFVPNTTPIAIFDFERTYLWNHPQPPSEFKHYSAALWFMEGRYSAIVASTTTDIAGVKTALAILETVQPENTLEIFALLVHESFHVHQASYDTLAWADEGVAFLYPDNDSELLALRRLESYCLAQLCQGGFTSYGWARAALAYRQQRFDLLEARFVSYERANEGVEGTALYVDHRAIQKSLHFPSDFPLTELRRRGYSVGAAWCFLLDALAVPHWQAELFNSGRALDMLVQDALSPKSPQELSQEEQTIPAATVQHIRQQAHADVKVLEDVRAEARANFAQHSGSVMQLEAAPDKLWQLTGFDPMNMLKLDDQHILHQRYAQFSAADHHESTLTAMGIASLSQAQDTHPVNSGLSSIVINLENDVTLAWEGGVLHIRSEQLQGTLHHVELIQEGNHYIIRRCA